MRAWKIIAFVVCVSLFLFCQLIFACDVFLCAWNLSLKKTINRLEIVLIALIYNTTHLTLKQVSIPSFQENLVSKMKYTPNTMKFGTQSTSNSLIINMIFEIADRDPKLNTWADLVSKLQCNWFLQNLPLRTNRTC